MNTTTDLRRPLRWFYLWLMLGCLLLISVIYVSLDPKPVQPLDFQYGDKLGHMTAYFVLMSWFSQLYRRAVHLKLAIALVAIGMMLEAAQLLIPERSFEIADMCANGLGAFLGWALAKTQLSCVLMELEQRFAAG